MKHKNVKFNPKRIVAQYKDGKCVAEIARIIGYPPNAGQNRTRAALVKAGVYKPALKAKKSAQRKPKAIAVHA